ncbi:hypothetical protein HS088_TW02G00970 [Tripterygium wilfordii]|uniref:Uncharacterized protein n=1 Tax=Tripterygium wilfordii TaxID=458696 RepID=A0A7J7E093_TRIWF|nr:hypothetical protein HS088_TW02G00970 [Tripterygium wilfordii]
MLVRRRVVISWRRVGTSLHALVAHSLLFSFTVLLVLKLQLAKFYSWWIVFAPLWLFHAVVSRNRFSLPAPSKPHGREVLSSTCLGYNLTYLEHQILIFKSIMLTIC